MWEGRRGRRGKWERRGGEKAVTKKSSIKKE
jgi:hypothetical protein